MYHDVLPLLFERRHSLLRLLYQISRATIDLPSFDKVVHDTQDEDKSEDRAGPANERFWSVSRGTTSLSTLRARLTSSYPQQPFL